MTKILSFNTLDKFIYLLLQEDNKILFKQKIEEKNKHSELLIPSIEKALAKFNLKYKDLDAISTIKGPGNFMGLRAGISVVKAIKISTQIPIITIDLFELASFDQINKKSLVIVLKANLDNYYIKSPNKKEPYVLNYENLTKFFAKKKTIKILTNDEKILKLPNAEKFTFDFDKWAKLIYQKYTKRQFDEDIKPLYIRPPKITKRKK